jgi:hypothetical protein
MSGESTILNTNWTKFGLGVTAFAALAGGASAQKASGAERGLIGVNLYDSGKKVVSLYGSPDDIQAVSLGGGTTSAPGGGGGPGFGGAGGGRGFPGGPGGPGGGGRGGAPAGADWTDPYGFPDHLMLQGPPGFPPSGGAAPMGGPSGPPGGFPGGRPGGPGGFPGGAPGGGGAPGLGGGATETTQYTRWVYNRGGSKYGFIIDNQGRVVQIEAIGLQNNRVKTRRGLGFGATFAQIIKTYGTPDGYEVGADSILVKYLVNKKVAFRLTRLREKQPHVVTGVVVAAGKV